MRADRRTALVGVVVGVLVLTGCSSTDPGDIAVTPTATGFGTEVPVDGSRNGIETVDGATALRDVLAAMRAEPFTATGTVTELVPDPHAERGSDDTVPGRTVRFDYRGTPTDSALRLSVGSVTLDARRRGDDVWVTGNQAFAERSGLDRAASGRVCVPAGSAALRTFDPFTTPEDLLQDLLGSGASVTLHPGAVSGTGKDARAQVVLADGSSPVGALVVSAVGQPVPYSLEAADTTGTVTMTFRSWGTDPDLPDPDHVVQDC
ncbi:hypothetical protein [Curtobacterium pusillum]|uniref:hypothetical protein n=1 Tax=Curtobacterium pusillum TaxID=69373 RepID=UPI00119D4298|nr:hypothetical protein [Curtobacterium pusillum]